MSRSSDDGSALRPDSGCRVVATLPRMAPETWITRLSDAPPAIICNAAPLLWNPARMGACWKGLGLTGASLML